MSERVLRIFVSSPTDVEDERRRVDLAAERLNLEFGGHVRLETVRWETSYYSAHETFQRQIPESVDCDAVVAIFRSRLGTELPFSFKRQPSGEPYPSGTAYEVLSAIHARRSGGQLPDIYVFRYPDAPTVTLDAPNFEEVELQWAKLKAFFETWFRTRGGEFIAAFQEYRSVDRFAEQIEDCLRQWLALRGFVPPRPVWDRGLQGSPFPGLSPYGAGRANVYFGRELAVAQAVSRFRRLADSQELEEQPFLLVVGASGAGKSSLLQAGILPSMTTPGVVPTVDLWRSAIVTPDATPFAALATALLADQALGPELKAGAFGTRDLLAAQLAGPVAVALLPIREALDKAASRRRDEMGYSERRPARLAIGLDQAERLFTEPSPAVVLAFADLLSALVRCELAFLAIALRSDAYSGFQSVEAFAALRQSGAVLDLLLPTRAELEEMVLRPVAACHPPLTFERKDGRSLSSVLVGDAEGGDALPLLQLTLSRLYDAEAARGDGILAFADYKGMASAITETGDAALAQLDARSRAQLPALISGLLSDVRTDPVSGERVPVVAPLDRGTFEAGETARAALIESFVTHRLLVSAGVGSAIQLRPVHEALLRIWPQARSIVAEIAALVQVRHALAPLVRAWVEAPVSEKPRHLDLSPALLGGAQQLLDHMPADLPWDMRTFVDAAVATFRKRQAVERRHQQRLLGATLVILAVVLTLGGLAAWQWRRTNQALVRERAAHAVALSQAASRDGRLLVAVRRAQEAFGADPSSETRSTLFSALNAVSPNLVGARMLAHADGTALAWAGPSSVAIGLVSGEIAVVPFSHDVRSEPKTSESNEPVLANHAVVALQRLSDGHLIALYRDATSSVLLNGGGELTAPERATRLTADPSSATSITADPSGERVAVASMEAGLVLVDGKRLQPSRMNGAARIRAVAFSPDGGFLAHGDDEGVITVSSGDADPDPWTVSTGDQVLTLAWSHDGRWLSAGTRNGRLALIDVKGRSVSRNQVMTNRPLSVLTWSSVDDRLAFNCGNLLLCVERASDLAGAGDPEPRTRLNGHQVTIRAAAWSQDGTTLASLDTSGQMLFWSTRQNEDIRFALDTAANGEISALAVDRGGTRVFGGTAVGDVYAWSPLPDPPRRLPGGDKGGVEALALSRDGRLAAARTNGILSLWKVDEGTSPVDISLTGRLSQVRWAPDDSLVAVLDPDARKVLFKNPNDDQVANAGPCGSDGSDTRPEGMAWAPVEERLFVSVHGAIRICDPKTGWLTPIQTRGDTRVAPMSLSVSHDGRWLATTGGELSASVYDLGSPSKPPEALPSGAEEPFLTQFSPSGKRLAVIAADGTLSLWDRISGNMSLFLRSNVLAEMNEADPDRANLLSSMAWVGDHRLALAGTNGSIEVIELDAASWQHRLATLDDPAGDRAH